MKFTFKHVNINVLDIEKSIRFYEEALGLTLESRIEGPEGSFDIAFLRDDSSGFHLELTYLKDHPQAYDLTDNEIHIAFSTPDMEASLKKHSEMGCVCFENKMIGIYFIEDPDGYWVEIIPENREA